MGQSSALTAKAFLGLVNLLAVMAVALFLSAGTWRYGLGWIFLLEFFAIDAWDGRLFPFRAWC